MKTQEKNSLVWDKNYYKNCLKENICGIKFTKKDGSVRDMRATLIPEMLPEVKTVSDKPKKAENPEVLAVFDLDKNEFRSFRIDSVIDFIFEA